MDLSDVVAGLSGPSFVTSHAGDFFVALQHGTDWRVGFRLTRGTEGSGRWEMTQFAAVYTGTGSATAEALRRLPIGALLREARRLVSPLPVGMTLTAGGTRIFDLGATRLAPFLADGRGRSRRTDEDFTGLALEYVLLVESGDRSPAKTLSEQYGHGSSAVWANRISEARRRGLLTDVRPGESGGRLTDKAERLLGYPEAGED